MELKKFPRMQPKKLRTIFIRYLFMFFVIMVLLLYLLLETYVMMSSNGTILPSYFSKMELSKARDKIANSKIVTPELIPKTCDYAVFTLKGKLISGNLSKTDAAKAWELGIVEKQKVNFIYQYLPISRKNQICIVRYTYIQQFCSPFLERYLPYPFISFLILFLVGFILDIFLLASLFARYLTKKMSSLQSATEKIQNQDLEFTVQSSGIQEIDNVLQSLDKMKEALKASLKKQWKMEKERRKKISALVHDIKTPLTIVRGNADLLERSNQTEKQKEYTTYIQEGTHEMEQYIKTLIEISKAENGYSLNKQPINSKFFIDSIHKQVTALTFLKKLTLKFETHNLPVSFSADQDLLQRALLNIVSNAVDFSPENVEIKFNAKCTGEYIQFCVIDCGTGFSHDALKNAAEQFYMADKSRTSKAHYGMGLFIAKSIAEQHGGRLIIANSNETGGGMVTIELPIGQKKS